MNPSPKVSHPYPEDAVFALVYSSVFSYQIRLVLCSEITGWTELFPFPYEEVAESDARHAGTGYLVALCTDVLAIEMLSG